MEDLEKYNWFTLNENSTSFVEELKRELGKHHYLSNKDIVVIAKNESNDDVLFLIEGKYYMFHLTYTSNNENPFPTYVMFKNIQEFKEYLEKNSVQ